jgi:hypothetical protein
MQWRRVLGWDLGNLGWRVAYLFMVGSLLFALGSFPLYGQTVDPRAVGLTFVAGSVFFTSAAVGQLLETIRTRSSEHGVDRLLLGSAAVQLVGTILFNINTVDAMVETFDTQQTNRLVWGPDMFGSIAFLVASHLAWLAVCHRLWCVRRDDGDWWVAAVNYLGSIFFMLAAIASFTLKTTGDLLNTTVVNSGTFLGALCFLAGAYLTLPAQSEVRPA